jgi:hypothetical protein
VIEARVDDEDVGNRTVGDVQLGAVEDVAVAVAAGGRAHRPDRVRPRARLGERQRADARTLAQPRKIAAPLLFVPVAKQAVEAEVVVGDPADRHRVVPTGDRLEDEPGGDERTANAPVLLGDSNAEITGRSKTRKKIVRPPLVTIHALRQRVELPAREPVGLLEDLLLFGRQLASASQRRAHRGLF